MDKIRVVLADDHRYVRTGIRNILKKTPDIVVVGEAEDGYQALRLIEELTPDVLVLDMEMPGLKGYEVAHEIYAQGSTLPVLALSAHEDRHFILGMLSEGAFGYLTKDEAPEIIVKAVRAVARGERGWVSRRVAARIAVWLQGERPDHVQLSDQHIEILRMLSVGKTSAQIGRALDLDEHEVEQKLEVAVNVVRSGLERLF